MRAWFAKHYPAVAGGLLAFSPTWNVIVSLLDWIGRLDAIRTYGGAVIDAITPASPWLNGLLLVAGLLLIWWDLKGRPLPMGRAGAAAPSSRITEPQSPPEVAVPAKVKTHPHDIPKKLTVIDDEIVPLIREGGATERHVFFGRQLLHNWKAAINTDRPSFLARLEEYSQTQSSILDEFEKIRRKNAHFDDIASLLDVPNSEYNFKETITKGFISFKAAIGALGDPPYKMDLDYFFKRTLQDFSSGLANLDGWRKHVERELLPLRKKIANGEG